MSDTQLQPSTYPPIREVCPRCGKDKTPRECLVNSWLCPACYGKAIWEAK